MAEILSTTKEQLEKDFDYLGYLFDRWQDESEYEFFEDYVNAIHKRLNYVTVLDVTNQDSSMLIKFKDECDDVLYLKVLPDTIVLCDTI